MRPSRSTVVREPWRAAPLVALALLPALGACIAPPLLLPAPRGPLDLAAFPPHAELVELPVAPETSVRGVFVPVAAGAPVVLDLLESGGSITSGARDTGTAISITQPGDDESLLEECGASGAPTWIDGPVLCPNRRRCALLPLLGWSTLCVDYEGVGASDGERSTAHLRRDAHMAWDEALRRADGDPSRVVLRGTSIGVLAAAALLQDGARPGAVILVAPVRSETITRNGARAMGEGTLESLFGWVLSEPVAVDLLEQVRTLRVPLLVIVPEQDDFLRHDERAALRAAVAESGGSFLVRHPDHIALGLAARDVPAAEAWFLARLPMVPALSSRLAAELAAPSDPADRDALAPGQPARRRLEQLVSELATATPGIVAACALADLSPAERREFLDQLAWMPAPLRAQLDASALARLADLADPAGRLDPELLRYLRARVPTLVGLDADALVEQLAALPPLADHPTAPMEWSGSSVNGGFHESALGSKNLELGGWINMARGQLRKQGLTDAEVASQMLRLILKGAALPDRVSVGPDGARIEVLEAGTWRTLSVPGWTP